MPGESEVGNGQVPELKVQDENNETVIQNGGPKKIEPEVNGTDKNQPQVEQIESSEVQVLDNQLGDNLQCELKKIEPSDIQKLDNQLDDNPQCELKKHEAETDETSAACPLRTIVHVEEVKNDTENPQLLESENMQCELKKTEPENHQKLEIESPQESESTKISSEVDALSCPLKSSAPVEEAEMNNEAEALSCPIRTSAAHEPVKVDTEEEMASCSLQPSASDEEVKIDNEEAPSCSLRTSDPVEEIKVDNEIETPVCPIRPSAPVEPVKVQSMKNGLPSQEYLQNGSPKKVSMFTTLDAEAIKAAYEDVRSDSSETQWAVFKFEGSTIALSATGAEFEKFREQFTENERGFGYIRVQTGDEMSKRQKFLFITWVGPGVSVIKRAKMSTDKALVKNIVSNFAVELQLENESDFDLKHFIGELNKAGGANYGTGVRDA